jgi:hypothetical protein
VGQGAFTKGGGGYPRLSCAVIMAWSETVALRRAWASSVMDGSGPGATVDTASTVSSSARETKMWSMSSLRRSKIRVARCPSGRRAARLNSRQASP